MRQWEIREYTSRRSLKDWENTDILDKLNVSAEVIVIEERILGLCLIVKSRLLRSGRNIVVTMSRSNSDCRFR